MPNLAELLRNHIRYNTWATSRLLNAATSLPHNDLERDFGTADKSVRGTLTHLFRAERSWLDRLQQGTPPHPWALSDDEQWGVLVEKWPKLHDEWSAWSALLTDEEANRELQYRDMKGNPWSQPISAIVLHVVNHSTHHRGQVSGFLRALGQTPPNVDFINYVRTAQR